MHRKVHKTLKKQTYYSATLNLRVNSMRLGGRMPTPL